MSDVALADLDGALAGTETIVAGITPGQWGAFAQPDVLEETYTAPFAPEVPVGALAINRLAGFLGRAVLSARRIPGGRSVA